MRLTFSTSSIDKLRLILNPYSRYNIKRCFSNIPPPSSTNSTNSTSDESLSKSAFKLVEVNGSNGSSNNGNGSSNSNSANASTGTTKKRSSSRASTSKRVKPNVLKKKTDSYAYSLFPDLSSKYVSHSDNNVDVAPYRLDEILMQEMLALLRGVKKNSSHISFLAGRNSSLSNNMVNSVIRLCYQQLPVIGAVTAGKMLEKIAMKFAKELQADFISITEADIQSLMIALKGGIASSVYSSSPSSGEITNMLPEPSSLVDGHQNNNHIQNKDEMDEDGNAVEDGEDDYEFIAKDNKLYRRIKEHFKQQASSDWPARFEALNYLFRCMLELNSSNARKVIYIHSYPSLPVDLLSAALKKYTTFPIVIWEERPMGFIGKDVQPLAEYRLYRQMQRDMRYCQAFEMDTNFFIHQQDRSIRFFLVPPADPTARREHLKLLRADLLLENFEWNIRTILSFMDSIPDKYDEPMVPMTAAIILEEREREKEREREREKGINRLDHSLMDPTIQQSRIGRSEAYWIAMIAKQPQYSHLSLEDQINRGWKVFCSARGVQGIQDATTTIPNNNSNNNNSNNGSNGGGGSSLSSSSNGGGNGNNNGGDEKQSILETLQLNPHEKSLLPCVLFHHSDKKRVSFDDIGSHEKVKEALKDLIQFRFKNPELFTKGVLKSSVSGILLFGPPGTGKTMLAKAVAAECGASFLVVTNSSIFDKYVGEAEKNTRALFTLARKLSPCVIFVDEVDSLLEKRSHSLSRTARNEVVTEFMTEWDGVSSDNEGIIVMGATNRPFALDDAALRRFPRRILVDLPNESDRLVILKILLNEDKLDPLLDLSVIAKRTELYSGSDLKNLCVSAAMHALKRQNSNISIILDGKEKEKERERQEREKGKIEEKTRDEKVKDEGVEGEEERNIIGEILIKKERGNSHVKSNNSIDAINQKIETGNENGNETGNDRSTASHSSSIDNSSSTSHIESDLNIIKMEDMEYALGQIVASLSDSMESLIELRKWDQQFGEGKKKNDGKGVIGFTDTTPTATTTTTTTATNTTTAATSIVDEEEKKRIENNNNDNDAIVNNTATANVTQ